MSELEKPGFPKKIAKQLLHDIDNYCSTEYDEGFRWHLGASLIGEKCYRKLWYTFRWVFHKKHDGRQQRLFNRGHKEEDRFVEWLKAIGCTVYSHNENGKQFRISGCNGHFGGSLDGIMYFPASYEIKEPVLLEFKTNGTGMGFAKLLDNGVVIAKEMHFTQMSTYGSDPNYNLQYAAYFNICKNDDNLHIEIVKLDHKHGNDMRLKAQNIIGSRTPPEKISQDKTFFNCVYCDFKEICHGGKPYEKNCRSCKNAMPVEKGEWFCEYHNGTIPRDFVKKGCDNYYPIGKQL